MFNSQGWRYLIADLEASHTNCVQLAPIDCTDNDSWQFRRGEISKLNELLGYQSYVEAVEAQMEEEDAEI